jgi:two-component system, LytTR family, response regulator
MLQMEITYFKKNELALSQESNTFMNKLRVATADYIYYIDVKDIVRIQSVSSYSKIFFTNGQTLIVSKVLAHFEEVLAKNNFSRIHRTHLVNLIHLKKYEHGPLTKIGMSNNEVLPVSRRKKKTLLQKMMLLGL